MARLRGGLLLARLLEDAVEPGGHGFAGVANFRLFTVTEAGREVLRDFSHQPSRPTAIRADLLVKLQAVDETDTDAVIRAVEQRMELSRAELDRYDRIALRMPDGRDEVSYLSEAERVGPYLTL